MLEKFMKKTESCAMMREENRLEEKNCQISKDNYLRVVEKLSKFTVEGGKVCAVDAGYITNPSSKIFKVPYLVPIWVFSHPKDGIPQRVASSYNTPLSFIVINKLIAS